MDAVLANGLTKYFGSLCAVDNVSIAVDNEIFGLLGPNGAGKSTIVKMLTTLLRPDGGEAFVCGHNVVEDPVRVRESLSYVPQEMAVDIKLTGRENVLLYAELYHISHRKDRVAEVIGLMGLESRADDPVKGYSGGMRRRLELAQALVHRPKVLFLDEPTLGLDVAARKTIWEHIHVLKQNGMTVFMTTHYMDEADRYCDRVAIIDRGHIAACDTPKNLKRLIGKNVITASVSGDLKSFDRPGIRILGMNGGELTFLVENGDDPLAQISGELSGQGLKVQSISLREPTLDDVFLDKVTAGDDRTGFDGGKYRLMLRRR